jgi:phosphopantetheine--protein transferase-like protein
MIGIDLVSIQEFTHQLEVGGDTFLKRAFHPEEYQDLSPEHLAGLWAAKEAIMKATDLEPGQWLHISISHTTKGRPIATVQGRPVEISIAHHGDYAIAMAFNHE